MRALSYQCESYECASLRIRSFRITRPQISTSIPSETDYPGLSQTQRIITGSPLGHCSLHAPRMEIHCWARCQRRLGGNTGYSFTPAYTKPTNRKTFSYSVSCWDRLVFLHFPLQFLNFFSSLLTCYIRSPSQTCSQLSCLPLSFRCLHFPFSPSTFFQISCVSSPSPPSGLFIHYTVETQDTNTAQTHLPCSPQM